MATGEDVSRDVNVCSGEEGHGDNMNNDKSSRGSSSPTQDVDLVCNNVCEAAAEPPVHQPPDKPPASQPAVNPPTVNEPPPIYYICDGIRPYWAKNHTCRPTRVFNGARYKCWPNDHQFCHECATAADVKVCPKCDGDKGVYTPEWERNVEEITENRRRAPANVDCTCVPQSV